jgi:phage shock protein A
MSTTEVEAKLRDELASVKARASDLSGDVDRLKKDLGNAHKKVDELAATKAALEDAQGTIKEQQALIAALDSSLKTQQALADKGAAAVSAGKAIAESLAKLGSL